MNSHVCYRIPYGVSFLRWPNRAAPVEAEWVIYHSGTGETLRLSEAALAILDALLDKAPLDQDALVLILSDLLDVPALPAELEAAIAPLLRGLLDHECIERVPCA